MEDSFHSHDRMFCPPLTAGTKRSTPISTNVRASHNVISDKPTSCNEIMPSTYSPTTTPPCSPTTTPSPIALPPPSEKIGLSVETDSVNSRLCASVEIDLSNSPDNSAFRVHSIPLKDWGDADSPSQSKSSPPRGLIEVCTSLSATGSQCSSKGHSRPGAITNKTPKLRARGIMRTTTSSMTNPLNSDQEASGIFPIKDKYVSEILPSSSSKSTLSTPSSQEIRPVHAAVSTVPADITSLSLDNQRDIVTAILDSGSGLHTISESLAQQKGLVLHDSVSLARMADGKIAYSAGSASVILKFRDTDVLSESCKLELDALGFNSSLLISRHMLCDFGFRFFDSSEHEFGSWIITPAWRWHRLRIEGGATVMDFQISVTDGNMSLSPIIGLPTITMDVSAALNALASSIPSTTSSSIRNASALCALTDARVSDGVNAVSTTNNVQDMNSLLFEHLPTTHVCSMSSMTVDDALNGNIEETNTAVAHGLRKFTKTELHEIFGHCSDRALHSVIDNSNLSSFKQSKSSKRHRYKCKCSSCSLGFHRARAVPSVRKPASASSTYETGECWDFDFGRYWSDPDIEGFRTDVTFVEKNSRFAVAVLLKDHTCLWEGIQELRRFVREELVVEVRRLHCDSDPMVRVNGAPSETYTLTRQKLSDAKIGCTFSPPNQHALNSYVENFRGRAVHMTNSNLQHAFLTFKLRGRAYLHAVFTLNCLPVLQSNHDPLKGGRTPYSLLFKREPDYSVFIGPWGSNVMVKSIGTRSSQLVPCSEFGILTNVSRGCAAWEIYLPHKQKFVTSTHVIVDSDMTKRLASVEKYDLVMENPGPLSHTTRAYAAGIRSLFSSARVIGDNMLIQLDPISKMPVKLIPFVDDLGTRFVMPQDRVDAMIPTPSIPSDPANIASDPITNPTGDSNAGDIGSAFVMNVLPINRDFPMIRPRKMTPAEKSILKQASDDTILQWVSNPKMPKSKSRVRYTKYMKTKTLGAFRRQKHRWADLVDDFEHAYVTLQSPAAPAPIVPISSLQNVQPSSNSVPHLSVLQHFESLPDMWSAMCDTQRISKFIYESDAAVVVDSPSTVVPDDDITKDIQHACSLTTTDSVTGPVLCSKSQFLDRITSLTTDNYLRVENMIRAAEQRPEVDSTDRESELLRELYNEPGVGDIFHGRMRNLSAAIAMAFPTTFKQAMKRDDREDWLRVSIDEWQRFYHHFNAMTPITYNQYQQMREGYSVEQVPHPIPLKWVFSVKRHASDGSYNRHKARLCCAQSLTRYTVDDKWSPTLSLDTMRLMLVLACLHDADIDALDVSGAYLTSKLEPTDAPIFVRRPDGLAEMNVPDTFENGDKIYCYRANVSIYGTQRACKQYLRSYFKFLADFGMKQSSIDPCLWYRVDSESEFIFIGVYSDDNLIISKGSLRASFQNHFNAHYDESPDSGAVNPGVHEFLGLMVVKKILNHHIIQIEVSSPKIIIKLREILGPPPSRFKCVPIAPGISLNIEPSAQNPLVPESEFNCRSVFGICLWAAMSWRFDIHYGCARIASSLSKGNTLENVNACKQLAWYLLETDITLKFTSFNAHKQFSSFCDASHGNDAMTLRSWFSYVHVWANAVFGGRTKLGTAVCRSTKDSEMMAIIACLASILGYRFLLHEIGFTQQDSTTIYIDASAALDQTTSMNVPKDQKFMAMRRRWVYEQFKENLVRAMHCSTDLMPADANTKDHTEKVQTKNRLNLQGHGSLNVVSTVKRHS